MKKTCPECGERFTGDKCPNCGALVLSKKQKRDAVADKFLTDEQRLLAQMKKTEAKKNLNTLIVALLVLAVFFAVFLYRNGYIGLGESYKTPVIRYFESISERDFNGYVDTMLPFVANEYCKEREELGFTEYEYLDKLYSDLFERYGDDLMVSLKFGRRHKPSAVYVKEFENAYLRLYGEPIRTDSVFLVDVTVTFEGSVSAETLDYDCYVIRHGGKWYIAGCDYAEER